MITLAREEVQHVLDTIERCYKMLLSEPNTKGALFKTENILRELLVELRARLAQPEPEFKTHEEGDDGWCDWTYPIHKGYLMKCCDCGLVHEVEFRVLKNIKKKKDGSKDGVLMDDDKCQVGLRMRREE